MYEIHCYIVFEWTFLYLLRQILLLTRLNFINEEFMMVNGCNIDCKVAPKIHIRVASEQRISTTKVFGPSTVTIDGQELTDLQSRVLPHFKSSDILLGLPAKAS